MPSSEPIIPDDAPGSYIVGTDGVRRPNPDDEATRKRLNLEAPAEGKSSGGAGGTDVP